MFTPQVCRFTIGTIGITATRALAIFCAFLTALILFVQVQAQPAQPLPPVFEAADCPMELPDTLVEGLHIVCGYLIVAQNRADPDSGTLRLAVAILKAKSATPHPDPIIFLTGGPGDRALGIEAYWSTFPTLEDRDFILIDPRGAGFSEPNMDCSDIDFPIVDTEERPATLEARREAELTWLAACRDLLLSRGIDLTQFNTAVWSADIADLRTALGLNNVNLFGVSYGAYWALGVVRDHPDGIRSITLDSVSPPPIDHWGENGLRADTAFNLLFEACASDAACDARFPTMREDFYAFVERLRQQPVRLPTANVNWMTDASFITAANSALYFPLRYPILPLALEQLVAENWEVAVQLGEQVSLSGNPAVFRSVVCHDEIPFSSPETFASSLERYPYLSNWLHSFTTFVEGCQLWGAGQAGVVESQPVVSDVPALILTGTFDPTTPPAYGRVAAETLSNSIYVEFPTLPHAVTFFDDCPRSIMVAFLNDPGAEPDSGCIEAMPPLRFETDVIVNRGIFQMAKHLMLETNFPVAGLAALSVGTFAIGAVAFPVHGWRTRRAARKRVAVMHLAASWLLSVTAIVFVIGLMAVVIQTAQVNQDLLLFGLPQSGAPVLVVRWALVAVLVITGGLLMARWRTERRVLPIYLIFIGISIVFVLLLGSWGMFG